MKDSYILMPGGRPTINKPASAAKVYGVDLTDILDVGDSVATATATAAGVTAGAAHVNGSRLTALVSGGTIGQAGSVRFDFTTAFGTTDAATIYFRVIAG